MITNYLVEEAASNGYNKLASNVKVVLGEKGITVGSGSPDTARYATVSVGADNRTSAGPKSGTYTSGGVQVENEAGSVLPSTGGIGTNLFYIIGGSAIAAAVLMILYRRKRAV